MAYGEAKVYNDGSHFVAIPHTETPRKWGKYKSPPAVATTAKRPVEQESLDVEKLFQECDPEERVFDLKSPPFVENKPAQMAVQNVKSEPNIPRQPSEKEVFNEAYAKHLDTPKCQRKKAILEEVKPRFKNEREAELFVDANMARKKNNLISRRIRMLRKAYLQEFNYFVTFTYNDAIHTEDSFKLKLRRCLAHYSYRRGWKYIGVWERSPEKNRLHFHGLLYVPEGTMPGEIKEVSSYSFSEHRMQKTYLNTHFENEFGRNDFFPLESKEQIGPVLAYVLKYIEKSGEKIVYSRGLPQFFISDILDEDVVCRTGLEDKKLLLFDNFSCFDQGCYVGPVSKETIKQLRKSN